MADNSELRGEGGKWKKGGPSPNPNGRPKKGMTIKDLVRKRLTDEEIAQMIISRLQDEQNPDRADKFLMRLWDGLDGKPAQEVINSGSSSSRVVIIPGNDRDRRLMDQEDEPNTLPPVQDPDTPRFDRTATLQEVEGMSPGELDSFIMGDDDTDPDSPGDILDPYGRP